MATFDDWIAQGWQDHAESANDVAARFAAALPQVASPDEVIAAARLATHVYGEHLGRWQDGIALLHKLRAATPHATAPAAAAALARNVATLRYAAGDTGCIDPLAPLDQVAVLAAVVSIRAGRGDVTGARAIYAKAASAAANIATVNGDSARALAVAGNNLATTLAQQPTRDAQATQSMLTAAGEALAWWHIAGGWLEQERALYRVSRCLAIAGDASAAVAAARRCVEMCTTHAAPAFEQFFAQAALALAHRSAGDEPAFAAARGLALAAYAQVVPDDQPACHEDLAALDARVRAAKR